MTALTPPPTTTCFNCGATTHLSTTCTLPQTESGKLAWKAFKNYLATQPKPTKKPRHYNHILQAAAPTTTVIDPVDYLHATRNTKRGRHDLHMGSLQFLDHIHTQLIAHLQHAFGLDSQQSSTKSGNNTLDLALGVALKDGAPAVFTQSHELALYTTYRLAARTRHLYLLLLSTVKTCACVRHLLLPLIVEEKSGPTPSIHAVVPPLPLQVCAIGGGPGFEHVALCSTAAYLASLQGIQNTIPPPIQTTLLDLYADHWREKMHRLNAAAQQCIPQHSETRVETCTLDLRNNYDNQDDQDDHNTRRDIGCFDLFLMCYVLHENAAFLIEGNDLCEGCITDILLHAKSGAVVLCCDASNRLWPVMTRAAESRGWDVETKPEKRVSKGGPKSCWVAVKR